MPDPPSILDEVDRDPENNDLPLNIYKFETIVRKLDLRL